ECVLRRIISAEGRSRGYINGSPSPLQLMKQLGEMLVDIHGQHQHQSLLKPDVQRNLLDDYAGNKTLADQIQTIFQQWQDSNQQLATLRQNARQKDARLELLRFHTQELEALALADNELQQLDAEQRRLANGGSLLQQCSAALTDLYDNDQSSALSLLNQHLAELESLRQHAPQLASICDMLNEASIQIQEGCNELRHYVDRIELDPERLTQVEQRLSSIHDMARKHHVEADALPELLNRFSDELQQLENVDIELETLQQKIEQLAKEFADIASKLSQKRSKAANKLAKQVSAIIKELGMPAGKFSIKLINRGTTTPHRHGLESISFEVAANPGQPANPLAKVASGGELSRISLAIEVLLCNNQQIPTLIFDEVDTGIGGAVAETVGRQLRNLGESHQVLCVTHLPQVAALGHQHFQVSKQTSKHSTQTNIVELSENARQDEIARMLGGVEITSQTRAHAEEMISRAEQA
ncbi:MAG TPA: DNA repair protein RecN, partial [Candidatus Tenderia electrophaga]|nr:DNA repair protein RecN [Candidatus Tenderia electrophaga]